MCGNQVHKFHNFCVTSSVQMLRRHLWGWAHRTTSGIWTTGAAQRRAGPAGAPYLGAPPPPLPHTQPHTAVALLSVVLAESTVLNIRNEASSPGCQKRQHAQCLAG